jgi:hypothetical protein
MQITKLVARRGRSDGVEEGEMCTRAETGALARDRNQWKALVDAVINLGGSSMDAQPAASQGGLSSSFCRYAEVQATPPLLLLPPPTIHCNIGADRDLMRGKKRDVT